jgi:hypothetical protein
MIGASNTLVSTILRFSQARPKLVARPRLIATLKREPGRKLTLISAPAGFGKITLLVEWLRVLADGEASVAWLSLDEGDNDPVRFLSYLVASLETTVGEGSARASWPRFARPLLRRLQPLDPDDGTEEAPYLFWRLANRASPGYRGTSVTVEVTDLERGLLSYHARPLRLARGATGSRFFEEDVHHETVV